MLGKFFQKPGKEESERVPPGQHLAKGFPVLTYGATPQVSIEEWEFRVWQNLLPLVGQTLWRYLNTNSQLISTV